MYGKLLIRCDLVVRTGLHIGGTDTYSAIGTVDSPVVRDPFSDLPIVPGSSLKGKLRSLLVRSLCGGNMTKHDEDPETVKRLFGSAKPVQAARLQFADCFVINADEMKPVGVTEVKTENGINRETSVANPRQIERVTAGTTFGVCLTYQMTDEVQTREDMQLLAQGMRLLQLDYLGGHGSRGSGRVSLRNFRLEAFGAQVDTAPLQELFREVEDYELIPL